MHHRVEVLWEVLQVFQPQCYSNRRPPWNCRARSQNRKRTGYWLRSTPKWALWFSAVSRQLSEQCAANKNHFINIPSARAPLHVNIVPRHILAPHKISHSGSNPAQGLLPGSWDHVGFNGPPLAMSLCWQACDSLSCQILMPCAFFIWQHFVCLSVVAASYWHARSR